MNKRDILLNKAKELLKKAKQIELDEQQKVGRLVLTMHAKNEISDEKLKKAIDEIIGLNEGK